ncbi:MAG: hypothetical protein J7J99_06995 [Thermoprotei archaeon]|nr:hypothetical protein [Thermoprotei archaeon]
MLKVTNAHNAFLVQDSFDYDRVVVDSISYATANILAGNREDSPAIEILNGYIEFTSSKPALIAVTGLASVMVNNKREKPWQLIPVAPNSKIRIETLSSSVAYISFPESISHSGGRRQIEVGFTIDIHEERILELLDELPARRIPSHCIPNPLRKVEISAELLLSGKGKLPKLFVIQDKDPHSISMTPIGNLSLSLSRVPDVDPKIGSMVVSNPNVHVITNPSSANSPIIAEIGPLSLSALARAPDNAIVKVNYSRSSEVKSKEIIKEVELIDKIKAIIANARNALQRGAKLVRVKIKEKIFEVWVEEA